MPMPTEMQRPGPGAVPAPSMAAGGPPRPPAAPPVAPGAGAPPPQGGGVPPQLQRHIDANNPVQAALMQRMQSLTAQDAATLAGGISPPALQVLKKMIPDIAFVWDAIAAKQGGGQDQGPGAGGAQPPQPMRDGREEGSEVAGMPRNDSNAMRPATRLNSM